MYMATIQLNVNSILYKGIKGNVTNTQSKLFWVTKNIQVANTYAKSRGGGVRVYKPHRKLKLLKLSRESIRRLLLTNMFSPNLRHKIILLFGIGISYKNQYEGLKKLNKSFWEAHFRQKYGGRQPLWNHPGGRISITNTNYEMFIRIRNVSKNRYDGIYIPEMRTPHYSTGSFPAEYILFNPRGDLNNITTEYNLNKARDNLNVLLGEMNNKREARHRAKSKSN
jgi:hypothetical protein